MARGHDDLGFRCGDLVGFDFADFETTFVVLAHGKGSATATATEVVRAVGCHFHHVCCCGIDHETDFIEKSPVSNQVTWVMYGNNLAIQRFVEFYSSASDIFPDEFNYRESVKIILCFEIIGAFPAHGSRTVATFPEYEAFAVQAVNLVVKIPGDLSRLFIITVEIPVVCHVVIFRREGPLFSRGIEYFCHGRDGKREKFRFPGIQGVKNVLVGLIKKDTGFFVFQFVLEFFFHPLDRVNKLFRGNTHVVSGIYCCIDSCLEGFRNESHDGKHFTSFFHKEGNVDPDRAMFHAASAHGTGSEQGVDHLVACLLV